MKFYQIVLVSSVSALLSTAPVCAGETHGPHWGYEGHSGPAHWGEISEDFAACGKGRKQSPIDVDTRKAARADLPAIKVNYKPTPLHVVHNGHTIQVNVAKGSTMTVGGRTHELVQFHFHTPSEHTVDGKPADMVAHFVHKAEDGTFGVIGVLMNKGAENAGLKEVWSQLPQKAGEYKKSEQTIDPAALLPAKLSYAAYSGSLTTPPCTEGVNWMVMTETITVSEAQLAKFAALFPRNNRPVQPLHDREVKLSF